MGIAPDCAGIKELDRYQEFVKVAANGIMEYTRRPIHAQKQIKRAPPVKTIRLITVPMLPAQQTRQARELGTRVNPRTNVPKAKCVKTCQSPEWKFDCARTNNSAYAEN